MRRKLLIITLLIGLISMMATFSSAEVNNTYDMEMFLGERINLKTRLAISHVPFTVDDQTVVQNMNASIISVDSYYTVATKEIGKGILILSNDNERLTINVSVISPIESIEFNKDDLTLFMGEIHYLDYVIKPKASYKGDVDLPIYWSSSKSHVATVADNNRVVTQGAGETIITGKMQDGSVVTTFDVRVLGHSHKLQVTGTDRIRQMNVGETLKMKASLGTKDVTNNIYWESLTPHILSVDRNGIVTAIGHGAGEIKAQSTVTSKHAEYKITSYSMIDKVELNKTFLEFKAIGQKEQLNFNLYPKNPHNPPIMTGYTYKTSNPEVVTVSKNGLITAKGPGIALVSVVFDDSQTTASCTVEVSAEVALEDLNTMPVQEITLKDYYGTAVIGQKIWLDYSVKPENANQQEIKFNVINGDNNQIHFIDDAYYFIPNRRGNIAIEVLADDGVQDKITIAVTSPIDEMKLSLATRRYIGTNESLLYVGEETELLNRIYTKDGFDKNDVYPTSLQYQVMNDSILELISSDNNYYIKALRPGKTEIRVTNLENFHEDRLWVSVEDPIAAFGTDDQVTLPVNYSYRPRLNVSISSNTKALTQGINFEDLMTLRVDKLYLPVDFINQEIAYETSKLESYGQGPHPLDIYDEVELHEERLAELEYLHQNVIEGYVLINNPYSFMDRNNRTFKFYSIVDHQIMAHTPLKMVVSLGLDGMNYKAKTTMVWQDVADNFVIKRLNTNYTLETLIQQYQLEKVLTNLNKEEQVELFITYLNNREIFSRIPTYEVLKAVSTVLKNDLLPENLTSLSDELTKADLVRLGEKLHKKYVNYHLSFRGKSSYYYDVIDVALEDSISLNYLKANDQFYFGTGQLVKEQDYYNLVRKIIPNHTNTRGSSTKNLTGERLVLLLNDLLLN